VKLPNTEHPSIQVGGHHPDRDGHGRADIDDRDTGQIVDEADLGEQDEEGDDSGDHRQRLDDEQDERVTGDEPAAPPGEHIAGRRGDRHRDHDGDDGDEKAVGEPGADRGLAEDLSEVLECDSARGAAE
jgi:hypothetical protein